MSRRTAAALAAMTILCGGLGAGPKADEAADLRAGKNLIPTTVSPEADDLKVLALFKGRFRQG